MLDDQMAAGCQNRMVLKKLEAATDIVLVVGRVNENDIKRIARSVEAVEAGADIPADDT